MASVPSGTMSVRCSFTCKGTAEHNGAEGTSSDVVPRRGSHFSHRTQRETRYQTQNGVFAAALWICPWKHISISS